MENGLTASDVALLNNDGMGGWNGMIWLFAILALMGGGFGGWNNNGLGYENYATSNEVQRGFDNQNLQAQTRDILEATNRTFHDSLIANQNLYNELSRDIAGLGVGQANLLANQNECCCTTKQMIMQNNYDAALRDAATNANFTAQIQEVKDLMKDEKIESLQAQIGQLQLQAATQNVVRYPNQWTYDAGTNPFCKCGTTTPTTGA